MLKTNCRNWFGVKSSNNMIIGFGGFYSLCLTCVHREAEASSGERGSVPAQSNTVHL